MFFIHLNSFLLKGADPKQVKFKQTGAGIKSACFIKAFIHIAILFYKVLFIVPGGLISVSKASKSGYKKNFASAKNRVLPSFPQAC